MNYRRIDFFDILIFILLLSIFINILPYFFIIIYILIIILVVYFIIKLLIKVIYNIYLKFKDKLEKEKYDEFGSRLTKSTIIDIKESKDDDEK